MKALPLLQALAEVQKRAIMQPVVGNAARNRVNAQYRREVDALIAFYSQPFDVRFLTGERAVFAGFTFDEDESVKFPNYHKWEKQRFYNDGYGLTFDGGIVHDYHEVSHTEEGTEHDDVDVRIAYSEPRTIAEFILYLDIAGVELELTPYGQEMMKGTAE